ncbi:MAG TPA: ABC transporter permease [Nanoarchaeota archaeon]|nr:ABC transporter permease [Nanoarchaeota archaeon]
MIADYFRLAFGGIRHRRLRSWLTLIGIFIGITAVVSLITLSQGMQAAINSQFEKLGSNRVMITPGGKSFGPTSSSLVNAELGDPDLRAVKNVRGVEDVMGPLIKTAKVTFKGETKYVMLFAYPTSAEFIRLLLKNGFMEIDAGRMLKPSDREVAVLGSTVAYDTFNKDVKAGDKILIEDRAFGVIGVRKKSGTFSDMAMGIPLSVGRDMYNEPKEISTIFAIIKEGYQPEKVVEDIKKALRSERNVEEGQEDFTVSSPQNVIDTLSSITGIVSAVLIGIAAISLIVGGIGIMNTMYTSVVERTREIGIMKATGATNSAITMLFLVESGLLGLIGGALGLAAGLGISKIVSAVAMQMAGIELNIIVTFAMVFGALAFSFVIGAVSGILPARKASKLQPVEALRR